MPNWISIFEETPTVHTTYYVKINGRKSLLPFDRFEKAMEGAETFLWLDESDDERRRLQSVIDAKTIDEFIKLDYQTVSEKLLVPYSPRIHKSVVFGTFHKYYLRIIASLRKQLSQCSKPPTMLNDSQEDQIRNFLTTITLYFQLKEKPNKSEYQNELLVQQERDCVEAVRKIIVILGQDGKSIFKVPTSSLIPMPTPQKKVVKPNLLDRILLLNNNPFVDTKK